MTSTTTTNEQQKHCRDKRRQAYAQKFALSERQTHRLFSGTFFLDQLDGCKEESAQRLLLGISEKKQINQM